MIVAKEKSSTAEYLSQTNCECLPSLYLHMLVCNFSLGRTMEHKSIFTKGIAGHSARVWAAAEQPCGVSAALEPWQMKMEVQDDLHWVAKAIAQQSHVLCSALTAQGVCLFCQLPLLALPFILTESCSASGSTL